MATADAAGGVARSTVAVAKWTLVSRLMGFIRTLVVAAILGPTYLGNTFQAANYIPLLTFEVVTGGLLISLLVPMLVGHVDRRDRTAVQRLAGSVLGLVVIGFGVAAVVTALLGPLLIGVLSTTAGDLGAEQRRVGVLLLVLVAPQVVLYGVAGVGAAVMNAHGRFALAAAAPAFESLGVIATMVVYGTTFGGAGSIDEVGTAEILVLGLGSTAAVAVHAGVQWWGALRVGIRLVPRAGWREPEVRELIARAVPSFGFSGLNTVRAFAPMVVANSVPGGVVVLYLAQNLCFLPVALGARPVSITLLPQMSRLAQAADLRGLRDELSRGIRYIAFLAIPAAVALGALSLPLARAAAFGEFATPAGVELLAVALAALSLGVVGDAMFLLGTSAAYALGDAGTPLRGMLTRTVVSLTGMTVAVALSGDVVTMLALGLAIAAGDLVGSSHLVVRLTRSLPAGEVRLRPTLVRHLAGSLVMLVPTVGAAFAVGGGSRGDLRAVAAMVVAGAVGAATFLALQRRWRSPELAFFLAGLRRP